MTHTLQVVDSKGKKAGALTQLGQPFQPSCPFAPIYLTNPGQNPIIDPLTQTGAIQTMTTAKGTMISKPLLDFTNHSNKTLLTIQRAIKAELLRRDPVNAAQLSSAIEPGGLLHGGNEVSARALRDTYRPWRRLIESLRADGGKRQAALDALLALNVTVRKQGKGFVFQLAQF